MTGTTPMTSAFPSPRRQFLLGLGTVSAFLAARPAAAFQVMPAGDYSGVIDHSCGVNSYHRQLLEEAAVRLGVTVTPDQMNQALAALKCPICGCPLVTAANPPATEAVHEQ